MISIAGAAMFLMLAQEAPRSPKVGAQDEPTSRPAVSSADAALAALNANVEYYLGESQIRSGDDKPVGTAVVLTRRALIQSENKILDQTTTLTARLAPQDQLAIMEVEGDQVTVRERLNAFAGRGALIGPAWKWTGLKYSIALASGGFVDVVQEYTDAGYVSKRTYLGPDRKPRLIFDESGRRISREFYEVLRINLRDILPASATSRPASQATSQPRAGRARTQPTRRP